VRKAARHLLITLGLASGLHISDSWAQAAPAERVVQSVQQTVEERVDWLNRRRTFTMNGQPYGFTAMPILFYTPSSGFHYGGWVEVTNYAIRPYQYRINTQWWLSTLGRRNHHVRMDIPELWGSRFNLRIVTQDLKDTGASYFGVGNDTEIDKEAERRESHFYQYKLEQQRTALDLEAEIWGPFTVFYGVRFRRSAPSRVDEIKSDYFVFLDPALKGLAAGWSNFLSTGLLADTRDDQEFPTNGYLAEISLQEAFDWLKSNYQFRRVTIAHTHYLTLNVHNRRPRTILVLRGLFENLTGDVPFYELTEVGGSIRGFDLAGNTTMRGYESRRFADKQKILLSAELRRVLKDQTILGHYFQSQGIIFADAGRVADRLRELNPVGLHPSGGVGARLTWNAQLSLRTDFALSPEGHKILISFGSLF
jgi:hypothetical protein